MVFLNDFLSACGMFGGGDMTKAPFTCDELPLFTLKPVTPSMGKPVFLSKGGQLLTNPC